MENFESTRRAIQHNCHIGDAAYARDYSLCTYLMKMREHYRWEQGMGLAVRLDPDAVGDWLEEREALWESLADSDFTPVPVRGTCHPPLAADAINAALLDEGLVYGGGLGRHGQPHFFLGRLDALEWRDDLCIYTVGEEYARDVGAPAAMCSSGTIVVRRQVLRQQLWEMFEEWRWSRRAGPAARLERICDLEADPDRAIDRLAGEHAATVLAHEMGEAKAGETLDDAWGSLLVSITGTAAELGVRAVRDNLADCLSTLPALIESAHAPRMHCYFAMFAGRRRQLFPALVGAYRRWDECGDSKGLAQASEAGREHWAGVAAELLALHAAGECRLAARVTALLDESARL